MSRSLVRGHELLRPFPDVFLLRSQGYEVQSAPFRDDNHYGYSALSRGYFICLYESQLGDDILSVSFNNLGLQTLQMFIGVILGMYVFNLKVHNLPVRQTWSNLACHAIVYFSYLYLFSKLFYNNYIVKKPTPSASDPQKKVL